MAENHKVLVTTSFRGVFFGELVERNGDSVVLANCRNCIYWERAQKGFLGLASDGPTNGCRIGPAALRTELFGVTSITDVTPQAAERWEAGPWR